MPSMLSQTSTQLCQGSLLRLPHVGENVDVNPASWFPPLRPWKAHLHVRRKLKWNPEKRTSESTRWRSHSIGGLSAVESLHREDDSQVIVRVSDEGAKELSYGSDELRLASRSATGNAADARSTELPELHGGDGYGGEGFEQDGDHRAESQASSNASIQGSSELDSKVGRSNGSARVFLRAPADSPLGALDLDRPPISSAPYLELQADNAIADANQGFRIAVHSDELDFHEKPPMATDSGEEGEADGASKSFNEEDEQEEMEYYTPKLGDYVMGVVVSGNYGKVDVDIGAKKLGDMARKEVCPLDKCDLDKNSWALPGDANGPYSKGAAPPTCKPCMVYDEEVLSLAGEAAPLPVEVGTVLTMEVRGETMSGRPYLSTRDFARRFAWQRVNQIKEQNSPVEIQITEWNPAGLIARIEVWLLALSQWAVSFIREHEDHHMGVRAFLPLYNLLKRPTKSPMQCLKEYMGTCMRVMITTVDVETSNLVVSEKHAWMGQNIKLGALFEGTVKEIHPYGVHVQIRDTDLSGVLHISNIARARIKEVESIFAVGEEIKVMVVASPIRNRIAFSTADLEVEDGLMLRDKQAVFRDAEKLAKAYRDAHPDSDLRDAEDGVESEEQQQMVIANWDWLDFGEQPELVR